MKTLSFNSTLTICRNSFVLHTRKDKSTSRNENIMIPNILQHFEHVMFVIFSIFLVYSIAYKQAILKSNCKNSVLMVYISRIPLWLLELLMFIVWNCIFFHLLASQWSLLCCYLCQWCRYCFL